MSLENKILSLYRGILFSRYDDRGDLYYFSHTDLDGINKEPYEFKNDKGQALRGGFYFTNEKSLDRIVIFAHGLGGGHRSYMREIEQLTRHGYTVLAYDNTGCMVSEGEGARGFSGSLADLDACIKSLRQIPDYKETQISVVGHSWGAYATLNICAYHPDITHICAISGFVSVERMLIQQFSPFLKKYIPMLTALERATNKDYADSDAITALHKSRAKALIIHSSDDKVVKRKAHFDVLRSALGQRPSTELLLLRGKGHNPNYTPDAVRYEGKCMKDYKRLRKKGKLNTDAEKQSFIASYDWRRMTAQDPEVWQRIFDFLDS